MSGGVLATLDIDFVNDRAWNNGPTTIASLLSCTRATPVAAYYTKADGTLTSFAANTLRYGTNGLLVEESRVNALLQSQTFNNASWAPANLTITANAATAPDGTLTADLVYPTTSGTTRRLQQGPTGSAVTTTWTIYAKYSGIRYIYAFKHDGSAVAVWFDIQNGAVGTVGSGYTASITALANGWYRCTHVGPGAVSNFSGYIGLSSADNSESVTANGTDGVYLWGAQHELGAFATSYIPTTTVAVTRAADVVTAGVSWLTDGTGTLYSQHLVSGRNTSADGSYRFSLTGGSGAIDTYCLGGASNTRGHVFNGANNGYMDTGSLTVGTAAKEALAFAAGDQAYAPNGGGAPATATITPATTGATSLRFGYGDTSTPGYLNGYIRRFAYWPSRLSNAALQVLTT
jgi:hypothetical protein